MSPLRRECVIALGGLVKDAVVEALEAEAIRRETSAVSADDIRRIVVPAWLYSALAKVEGRRDPTILGRPLSPDEPGVDRIKVIFIQGAA